MRKTSGKRLLSSCSSLLLRRSAVRLVSSVFGFDTREKAFASAGAAIPNREETALRRGD